ncbi:DNA helicase PIF1, ATP-dependent [Corchorus olitorius]|uniref:ATP-dependent DNA helicase n=1 Tax=Corchorus olitorius TaxID=93759 RepID=A0A1R3G569_9ROSI|nr:DNA helicase PIF1, ATP-dependent [Corchorus olitorius]
MDQLGYPTYRRRDTGVVCVKNGVVLDNRFVVPHNVDLLVRYQAHINVEVCNQSRAIKYLFKYINKGPDRSRVVIESNPPVANPVQAQPGVVFDEIKAYLDCRYVCAYEACWRLFSFDIHFRQPAVLRLLVHLQDRHNVFFRGDDNAGDVLSRPDVDKTMFTEWMSANKRYAAARELLYADFPRDFVWHANVKRWEPRRRGQCIGRVIQINAQARELYYLRLLLNVVRGPRSFEEIRTVNAILHPTFQAAAKARRLTGDDKEWNEAILEASHSALAYQLRQFFVMIIVFCQRVMGDDIEHQFRRVTHNPRNVMPDAELRNIVLSYLDDILHRFGSSLADKNLPLPRSDLRPINDDRLILEEMSCDRIGMEEDCSTHVGSLNPQQRSIYEAVLKSVNNSDGKLFFVHGHGGTGKTFLWKALLARVRLDSKIALAVASSGIASLLLPGGRTAHSRFKIPLHIDQWSTCQIVRGTQLARLVQQTSLIVWDEAPMMHRHCIEALDRSLRDVRSVLDRRFMHQPFGGITVAFGGDLRQILPVIPGATRSDVVNFTLCNSPLWQHFHLLHLTGNMRLLRSDVAAHDRDELRTFASVPL